MEPRRALPYLLALPALLLLAALAWALAGLVVASVQPGKSGVDWFGQYTLMLATPQYRGTITTSLWIAFIGTIGASILAYPVALEMRAVSARARRLILSILVLVFFSDYLLRMFGLVLVLGRRGLVNRVLDMAGLTEAPLPLMYNEFGVVIGMIASGLPFMIFSIEASLARIDPAQFQAATLLGANRFRLFLHIALPLSVPGLVSGGMIVFLMALNSIITPALLGGGFVHMIAGFIYDRAIGLDDLSLAAAASMVLFLLSLLLVALVNLVFDRFSRRFGVIAR